MREAVMLLHCIVLFLYYERSHDVVTLCYFFITREDMYAQDSIELLQNCGIQFKRHEEEGIVVQDFAELLMTSGIVLTKDIKWLSFHR